MTSSSVPRPGNSRLSKDALEPAKAFREGSGAPPARDQHTPDDSLEIPDAINPQALKLARKRRGWTQQELADAVQCTKDTVSRWERGKSRRVRAHLRQNLCGALRITWEKLTEPADPSKNLTDDVTTTVSISKHVRTSLDIVAVRYNVSPRDVLDLAPLLFLIVAERSLLERKQRLQAIHEAMQETEEKLLENCAHLGPIIAARSNAADQQLDEEEQSLRTRDVFGRTIMYEYWNEDDTGPFVHYVRDLANGLPKDAVTDIESFNGDTIERYRIADDTLRACTGISEAEQPGKTLLNNIRCGQIDFAECLRVRRDEDEEGYQRWLTEELARAEEESRRQLEKFMDDFGVLPLGVSESDPTSNSSDS